jgi:hypothetical protein
MGLTIAVPNYKLLPAVAQRALCWAGPALRGRIGINSHNTAVAAVTIPDALILALGPLELKEGGVDVTAGFAAGQNVFVATNNGDATFINTNNCAGAPATPPQILSFVVVTGLDVELTYDNSAAGTGVFVDWGDGVIEDLSGDAAGTFPHTYPLSGVYLVQVIDAGDDTNVSIFHVAVPQSPNVN